MAVAWNLENATHLLRRAAFGGRPADIQAFHDRNPSVESAVNELLGFKSSSAKPPSKKNSVEDSTKKMRRWWLALMVGAKKPADACREKLVLFWHNHLVSGSSKQPDGQYLAIQNQLFRANAKGNFKTLLRLFNRDPANLYYLDGITNYASTDDVNNPPRATPNENFAREVMELFTLGVYQFGDDGAFDVSKPNYTENDVHQLARAVSGWTQIKGTKGLWNPDLPNWDGGRCDDDGDGIADPVVIFGFTNNNFRIDDTAAGTSNDVLELLCSIQDSDGNNQAAMFLARKFWSAYAYPPPAAGLKALLAGFAAKFAAGNYEIAPLLRDMWTHDAFYSDQAKSRAVKSPVDYIVQSMRSLGMTKTDGAIIGDGDHELGEHAARMGMNLFDPPNVAGWKGGLTWINSGTLLARADFARSLAAADSPKTGFKLENIPGLPLKNAHADPGVVVDAVMKALGLDQGPVALTTNQRAELLAYATSNSPTLDLSSDNTDDAAKKVRGIISLALQCAEYMMF